MNPEVVHAGGCALFLGAMVWAAVSDLLTMRIANRVSGGLALGYIALAPMAGASAVEIGLAAVTAAAVLAAGFAAFAFGVMGGGDGKLAAASALWLGPERLPVYLLTTALAGGALALTMLAFRGVRLPQRLARRKWARRLHARGRGIPYGVALAFAGALALRGTIWAPGGP